MITGTDSPIKVLRFAVEQGDLPLAQALVRAIWPRRRSLAERTIGRLIELLALSPRRG